jgi:hypothetical protein
MLCVFRFSLSHAAGGVSMKAMQLVVKGVLTCTLQLLMLEPWLQGRAVHQLILHQVIHCTVDLLLVLKEGL